MNIEQLRRASALTKEIDRLDELKDEVTKRDVDFVEHDRVYAIGRMQLDEKSIQDLKATMMRAVEEWFTDRKRGMLDALEKLGVETE